MTHNLHFDAMNVADDALSRDRYSRGVKDRSRQELGLLGRIEKASLESVDRCRLPGQILRGDSIGEFADQTWGPRHRPDRD